MIAPGFHFQLQVAVLLVHLLCSISSGRFADVLCRVVLSYHEEVQYTVHQCDKSIIFDLEKFIFGHGSIPVLSEFDFDHAILKPKKNLTMANYQYWTTICLSDWFQWQFKKKTIMLFPKEYITNLF